MVSDNDIIFHKIAEALLVDYSSVYYVNAVTNEYQWYSMDSDFCSLQIEQGGKDFFKNMVRDADRVVYEEDKHIFMKDISKEKLMSKMKKGMMQNILYRLMIDGKPVYHSLRLIRGIDSGDDYFVLGVLNVDEEIRKEQEMEKIEQEREVFNQISRSLAEHYDTLYYVDIETDLFYELSSVDSYKKLKLPTVGNDYFSERRKNIKKYVHPEDREMAMKCHYKDVLLENLKNKPSFSMVYRLKIGEIIIFYRDTAMWTSDKKHIIACLQNINAEVCAQNALKESRKKSNVYGQIAESLAAHYDMIYYVDAAKGNYVVFKTNNIYGNLELPAEGPDFFAESRKNTEKHIYESDKVRMLKVFDKEKLMSSLEHVKQCSLDYRMIVDGEPKYMRITAMWSSDRTHFIIGVENVEEEVRKEMEHARALRSANEKASVDELTGVKNKNAYQEMEGAIQEDIDRGAGLPFALVICDLNNLKLINDTLGHKAGDESIKAASRMICSIFSHSPVFRIGGDEFVVILSGRDYSNRDRLFHKLRHQVLENQRKKDGPIVASGMSVYRPKVDKQVEKIFESADSMMYENKRKLKENPQ